jgi:hypothetical protein
VNGTTARPTGITILAILALIGGVFGLIAGLGLIAGGALLGGMVGGATGAQLGGLAFIFGIITLGLAVAELAFAYGAWTLQPWGWSVGVILQLANLVWIAVTAVASGDLIGSLGGSIISIAVAAIILWYLNQPTIKAAFGRS